MHNNPRIRFSWLQFGFGMELLEWYTTDLLEVMYNTSFGGEPISVTQDVVEESSSYCLGQSGNPFSYQRALSDLIPFHVNFFKLNGRYMFHTISNLVAPEAAYSGKG